MKVCPWQSLRSATKLDLPLIDLYPGRNSADEANELLVGAHSPP